MTTQDKARTERLHRLIDLARTTRGWSRAELARQLRRDPTKVYPESGNPKSDFVVALARALDWPVGSVLETIWNGSALSGGSLPPIGIVEFKSRGTPGDTKPQKDFEFLYAEAKEAHDDGRYRDMIDRALRMYAIADSQERRAFACAMEASGWDGLGRYTQEVEACRRGLACSGVSSYTRNILRSTLANAWYSLWDLEPALGTAELLANHYESNPPERDVDHKRVAFVHYLRGNIRRRLMSAEPEEADRHCELAIKDLSLSRDLYLTLSDRLGDKQIAGIANTCEAGLQECLVFRGDRDGEEVVSEFLDRVETALATDPWPKGDWLESWGWTCIFGTNIAIRSLDGPALQAAIKSLLGSALDIAESMDHWAMRERVYSMQLSLHNILTERTGLALDMNLDEADQTLIVATMSRFPAFQRTGWTILETARCSGESGARS